MSPSVGSGSNLSTRYLGLSLRSPIVAAPCPLWQDLDAVRAVVEAGAGAVVLPSLFEEQIMEERLDKGGYTTPFAERYRARLRQFPGAASLWASPEAYVEHIARTKAAVDVPVFASINGFSPTGWVRYAREIEAAGADGLEVNFYFLPTEPHLSATDVERRLVELVSFTAQGVHIPVVVKLLPQFSAPVNLARQLRVAGARGVVLFNRYYTTEPGLSGVGDAQASPLSTSAELGLRLRWAAAVSAVGDVEVAVSGGVHTGTDALEAVLAGARVAQVCSAILRHGVDRVRHILTDMGDWMREHHVPSIDALRGGVRRLPAADREADERARYTRVLRSWRGAAVEAAA